MASTVEVAGGKGGLDSFQLPPGLKEYLWVCDHGDSGSIWVCRLGDVKEYLGLSSWGLQGVSGSVILGMVGKKQQGSVNKDQIKGLCTEARR